jgi:hypothetical protein
VVAALPLKPCWRANVKTCCLCTYENTCEPTGHTGTTSRGPTILLYKSCLSFGGALLPETAYLRGGISTMERVFCGPSMLGPHALTVGIDLDNGISSGSYFLS